MTATTFYPPAVTRMLLASDGSTTILLETLVGAKLSVEVIDQGTATAGDLSPELRDLVGADEDTEVVVRRSALHTGSGERVSENYVVSTCRADHRLSTVITDRSAPIGHGLTALGLSQARRVVEKGQSEWTGSGRTEPCAFKAYVLLDEGAVLYIHEKFNPRYVPVSPARCQGGCAPSGQAARRCSLTTPPPSAR